MKILDFPDLRQTFEYDCGASVLQSILVYFGIELREEIIINEAKTTETGTSVENIEHVLYSHGLELDSRSMDISDIKKYLDKDVPVILLLQAWSEDDEDYKKDWKDGHYVVALGYDEDKLYFEDPYTFKRAWLSFNEINDRWHDVVNGKKYFNHGIAVYGKNPVYNSKSIEHMD